MAGATTIAFPPKHIRGNEAQTKARIYLAGTMRAVGPDGEDVLPYRRKTRALLAYLCLMQGERAPRSRLAGILWDRSGDAQARGALRQALWDLNSTANRVRGLIEIDRDWVRVDPKRCWIDIFAEPDHVEGLLEDMDGISPSFDQWLVGERLRFEDRLRANLEAALNQLVAENAAPELRAAAARKLINFEPTHEGAARQLMTAFVQMGDRAQAIREYERCRNALRNRLDLYPSKETTALYEAARLMSRTAAMPTPGPSPIIEANTGELSPDKAPAATATGHSHRPSIAVLPFRNLSVEARRDYAADGLVEDLVEALSRIPGFFVISRLSTLAFRDQDRLAQQIGEALGVRYVVSGSMRVIGDRLRLTVELTDTRSGAALWVSKLDEQFFDLLEVQNRLSAVIVGRVAPYLYAAELQRARIKRPDSLEAYDLFLRAQENMHNSSRTVFESSEVMFDEAIARDPHYAAALAWRAYWHVLRVGQGWSPDPGRDAKQADHFARRAVECDALEPMAFAVGGHIASYLHKDFDLAFERFETALRINPNAAPAWLWSAAAHAWLGDGPRAVDEINRAMALSPYDPLLYVYSGVASLSYSADGQHERAVEFALRCMRENRTYTAAYWLLIVSLVLVGRASEAKTVVRRLLKLELDFNIDSFRQWYPGNGTPHGERCCDALAQAGVPLSKRTNR